MASGGREQKRPTVQWFWEVHCKNEPQYNGFGKSTAKTTDCTMVWGGRLQKRPPVQWFWEVDCQTDRRSHGFRRSTSFAHFSETTTGGGGVSIGETTTGEGKPSPRRDDDEWGWSSPKPRETRKGRRLAYYPVKCVRKRTKSLALARSAKASDHSDFRVAGHPVKFVSCIHL